MLVRIILKLQICVSGSKIKYKEKMEKPQTQKMDTSDTEIHIKHIGPEFKYSSLSYITSFINEIQIPRKTIINFDKLILKGLFKKKMCKSC